MDRELFNMRVTIIGETMQGVQKKLAQMTKRLKRMRVVVDSIERGAGAHSIVLVASIFSE
jgi:ribosomal protein S24E